MRRKGIDANEVVDTSTIPVYQSEIAPPKIRGFLVLFEGALITLGVMISYWLNYGTSVVLSFLLRQVPPILSLIRSITPPSTPKKASGS